MTTIPNKIILFDGVCNLCDSVINFILQQDKKRLFKYASLQSSVGKKLSNQYRLPLANYKTFVYIKNGKTYLRSNAALEICKDLGGFWYSVYICKYIIPPFLRDWLYNFISKKRYSFFRKKTSCIIPNKEIKKLFLDF